MRNFIAGLLAGFSLLVIPATASAHVIVSPKQVGVAAYQTFNTSVPNEKEVPVTALRVVIPGGLKEVTPTVKTGWNVTTKKSGDTVTEIDWSDGSIAPGLRDDFTFSAQVPSKATTLQWKAYQTYQDGSVVSWDQTPMSGGSDDATGDKGPASTTQVVNDIGNSSSASGSTKSSSSQVGPYIIAGISLLLSVYALTVKRK